MIDQSNYAIQAEQNIWNLESDRTEKESRIWVQNLQYFLIGEKIKGK